MWNDVFMNPALSDDLAAAVAAVTPRRFELLLTALAHGDPFTVGDLRERSGDEGGSLPRDVRALELGGWFIGDPPAAAGRQGRTVSYTVSPLAIGMFPELARLVEAAITSRSPSRDA